MKPQLQLLGHYQVLQRIVSLSTGDMYVKFSQSSGTLYNVQVNVDTLGV